MIQNTKTRDVAGNFTALSEISFYSKVMKELSKIKLLSNK